MGMMWIGVVRGSLLWPNLLWASLLWLLPVALLISIRSETSRNRVAKEMGDGRVLFELDQRTHWSWLALFVYLLYVIVIQFGGGRFRISSVWVALGLAVLAAGLMWPFPETITAGPEGLTQEIWFWLRKKKIAWKDVLEIRAAKNHRLLFITGADGTKIVHTRQLPDRDCLLAELHKHCGERVPVELRPVVVEASPQAKVAGAAADAGPATDAGPVVDA